jgi:hypothetical protein
LRRQPREREGAEQLQRPNCQKLGEWVGYAPPPPYAGCITKRANDYPSCGKGFGNTPPRIEQRRSLAPRSWSGRKEFYMASESRKNRISTGSSYMEKPMHGGTLFIPPPACRGHTARVAKDITGADRTPFMRVSWDYPRLGASWPQVCCTGGFTRLKTHIIGTRALPPRQPGQCFPHHNHNRRQI